MRSLRILMVAPYAPPLNHAEPIQVGRFLTELLKTDFVRLVTERPSGSWATVDPSLDVVSDRLVRHSLALPFHEITMRAMGRWPVANDSWPLLFAKSLVRKVTECDVIYSRSMPVRGAILAARLKSLTGKPWVMHLSDPWADSPFPGKGGADAALEAERKCFRLADGIAVTTVDIAEFYRRKYPGLAGKIFVSPNAFAAGAQRKTVQRIASGRLRAAYTGALYGNRSPAPLLAALNRLPARLRQEISIDFVGHADDQALALIRGSGLPSVRHLGPKSFTEARSIQAAADLLITIEETTGHELDGTFLLSKLLDYLPQGKPILALAPPGSVTSRLIDKRYGWSMEASDSAMIGKLFSSLVDGACDDEQSTFRDELPAELCVAPIVADLRSRLMEIVDGKQCK